ncbi:MAG: hypothetical protein QM589_18925 [Thermomicrobiales bacterium]
MGKRLVQGVLLAAVFLILPVSLIGIWVRQEVVDTDAWVASVRGLPADPDVQDAVARAVGDAVSGRLSMGWEDFVTSTVDNRTIRNQVLAMNVDVHGFVEDQTRSLMHQPAFTDVWIAINQKAHPLVRDILLGNDTAVVSGTDGAIRLDLAPVYVALVHYLTEQGIDVTRVLPAQIDDTSLTIYDSSSLQTTQRIARLIDRWAIPLAVIAGVLALLVLAISQRKALAGAVIGLTVLLSMAVSLVGLTIALRFLLDQGLEPVERDAAIAVARAVTASLREWALAIGIVGAAVMVVCLLMQIIGHRQARPAYRR